MLNTLVTMLPSFRTSLCSSLGLCTLFYRCLFLQSKSHIWNIRLESRHQTLAMGMRRSFEYHVVSTQIPYYMRQRVGKDSTPEKQLLAKDRRLSCGPQGSSPTSAQTPGGQKQGLETQNGCLWQLPGRMWWAPSRQHSKVTDKIFKMPLFNWNSENMKVHKNFRAEIHWCSLVPLRTLGYAANPSSEF